MNPSSDLVNKLWRLCAVLRKDGITYQQYVTELTYLLFLKMEHELGEEEVERDGRKIVRIPEGLRWSDLVAAEGIDRLSTYRDILATLGDPKRAGERGLTVDRTVQAIYANSATIIREPKNLSELVSAIDSLDWFSAERDSFGDLYEGLLQKNAEETKRGAGQYFTPRVLIETIVGLMKPKPGETIQDPAAGTGGFLIAADRAMRAATDDYFDLDTKAQEFQLKHALHGMENVPDTYRLLLMNLFLHRIESAHIHLGDTLSPKGAAMPQVDLILTNPPFGPAGGRPTREDFTITQTVSSYQLPFVEHCLRALKPGGRAAMIVPDNVLFEDGKGKDLRRKFMDEGHLHTILRLPTGIFYAQGVKTNVVFYRKGLHSNDKTQDVWIYDLRSQMPPFGKTNPIRAEHFKEFVEAYGDDPNGKTPRIDLGENGRFRRFTRHEIGVRDEKLDISWLREDENNAEDQLTDPEDIAGAIIGHLKAALAEIEAIAEEIGTPEESSGGLAA
jgi:type I restriction enzyme M protein